MNKNEIHGWLKSSIALVVCLLFSFSPLFSQETDSNFCKITVTDTLGIPLQGAAISYVNDNRVVLIGITDFDGIFTFDCENNSQLKVSLLGYQSVNITGESANVVLKLDPFQIKTVEIIGVKNSDFQKLTGTAFKLSKRQLEELNPLGTQESLEFVPGVNGFSDDGIGNSRINVGIRGINPRRSSRVLVLEDGIPIQPALYVYSNMYYNPPIERISEIEVIKGSSSIEYGPHTMGGIINYITSRPREDFGGRFQLIGGSNGYSSALLEIGGFGSEKLRPEVQLLYKTGDGFRENNGFEQFNGTFKILYQPSERKRIYLNLNANYENSNATYTGLTEYSFREDYLFNPKEFDEFTVQRYSANIIQQVKRSKRLEETTKVYFNYFDRDWWREYDVFTSAQDYEDGDFTEIPLDESQGVQDLIRVGGGEGNFGILRTFSVFGIDHQYQYQHQLGETASGNLHVGGRAHFERFLDNAGNGEEPDSRVAVAYRANNYETYAYSLFARETITIDNLILSPGVRMELFEQEMVNRLNGNELDDATTFTILPGIGLNYEIDDFNVFAGFHRGMTPPSNGTLLALNFGLTDGTDFESFDLRSETSWNQEIGIRGNKKWVRFELTGFRIDIENLIAAARGTQFTNLNSVRSEGLESFVELKTSSLNKWLPDFFCSYTYLQTEILGGNLRFSAIDGVENPDVSGNELPYAPNHNVVVGMNYRLAKKYLLNVNYRYVSRSFSDYENITFISNRGDTGPIPAYFLLSANASAQINKQFRVFVSAKNILDERYIGSRLHSNPRQQFAAASSGILPGAERQINVGLNYQF
ncbi:MAG: TonB-dependent receptor [Bacteroidota bacterium]